MSLFDPPHAIELTEDVREELRLSSPDGGQLLEIKPYKESERGMRDNIEMYKSFHNRSDWHGFNASPTNSFEIWFDGENVRFFMYVGDESTLDRSISHITSNFPSARITLPPESHSEVMLPDISDYKYVAGAHLDLAMHFFSPIRNPQGVEEFHAPYRNIIADMTNSEDVTEVIQILFRPAGTGWTSSYWADAGEFAEDVSEGPPGELDAAAKNIKSQIGQPGFYIDVRVLCFGNDKDAVLRQRDHIGKGFNQYYREYTGQTFVPQPRQGYELQRLCNEVIAREGRHMDWPGLRHLRRMRNGKTSETIIMTIPELAGLSHIPNQDHIDNSAIDWVRLDSSNRLPAQAPKYEDNKRSINKDDVPWAENTDPVADTETDDGDDDEEAETPPSSTDTASDPDTVSAPDSDESHPELPEDDTNDPELPDAENDTPPALDEADTDTTDEGTAADDDRWDVFDETDNDDADEDT